MPRPSRREWLQLAAAAPWLNRARADDPTAKLCDLLVRGGTVVDGTGNPWFRGDVAVTRGRITAVGRALDLRAARTIDAAGLVVAPGFIDPHTHYDAQVCFDPYAFPALEHGVTSVVTGNCSLSLAPVRAAHRERFSRMYRLIEEMPAAAFDEGVDWRWGESFGGMLDAVAGSAPSRLSARGMRAPERPATVQLTVIATSTTSAIVNGFA